MPFPLIPVGIAAVAALVAYAVSATAKGGEGASGPDFSDAPPAARAALEQLLRVGTAAQLEQQATTLDMGGMSKSAATLRARAAVLRNLGDTPPAAQAAIADLAKLGTPEQLEQQAVALEMAGAKQSAAYLRSVAAAKRGASSRPPAGTQGPGIFGAPPVGQPNVTDQLGQLLAQVPDVDPLVKAAESQLAKVTPPVPPAPPAPPASPPRPTVFPMDVPPISPPSGWGDVYTPVVLGPAAPLALPAALPAANRSAWPEVIARGPLLSRNTSNHRDTGLLQDMLISLNTGPQARALMAAITKDPSSRGDFGPITEAAVKEFQAANTIDNDGAVGPAQTWPALGRATSGGIVGPVQTAPAAMATTAFDPRTLAPGQKGGGFYRVKNGDNPSLIAKKLVNDSNRWRELRDAQPDPAVRAKISQGVIQTNQILTLPASWS